MAWTALESFSRTRPAARRVSTRFRLRDFDPHGLRVIERVGLIRFMSVTKALRRGMRITKSLSSLDN